MDKPGLHLTVKCIVCGEEFRQSRSDQEYCSDLCYRFVLNETNRAIRKGKSKLSDKDCEVCGTKFMQTSIHMKHCSFACTYKKRRKTLSNGMGSGWSKGKRFVSNESTCIICGVNFHVPPSIKNRGENHGKFCSKKCRGIEDTKNNELRFTEVRQKKLEKHQVAEQAKKEKQTNKISRILSARKPCRNCGKDTEHIFCDSKCYFAEKEKNKGSNLIKKPCLNCGKEIIVTPGQVNAGFGKYCSSSCSAVARIKNRNVPMIGNAKGGKRPDLNNQYFRSRWEANYARYLNVLIQQGSVIKWEFEPETFYFEGIKRGTVSYTPDFKVLYKGGRECFIEIKGYMSPKSTTRMKRMKKYYPHIIVELIDSKKYLSLHRQLKHIVPNWEVDENKKYGYRNA